jgi:hypothetical protein
LKIPLRDVLAMTHREFLTWQAWFAEQWSVPSREDYYLAQIACEVRRVLSRKPGKVLLKDFVLQFGEGKAKPPPMTREQAAEAAKARWAGFMTKTVKKRSAPPGGKG